MTYTNLQANLGVLSCPMCPVLDNLSIPPITCSVQIWPVSGEGLYDSLHCFSMKERVKIRL